MKLLFVGENKEMLPIADTVTKIYKAGVLVKSIDEIPANLNLFDLVLMKDSVFDTLSEKNDTNIVVITEQKERYADMLTVNTDGGIITLISNLKQDTTFKIKVTGANVLPDVWYKDMINRTMFCYVDSKTRAFVPVQYEHSKQKRIIMPLDAQEVNKFRTVSVRKIEAAKKKGLEQQLKDWKASSVSFRKDEEGKYVMIERIGLNDFNDFYYYIIAETKSLPKAEKGKEHRICKGISSSISGANFKNGITFYKEFEEDGVCLIGCCIPGKTKYKKSEIKAMAVETSSKISKMIENGKASGK